MKLIAFTLLLSFTNFKVFSNTPVTPEDSAKVKQLKVLAKSYLRSNYDSVIYWCDKGIELANNLGMDKERSVFYSYKGLAYYRAENYVKALEFDKQTMKLKKQLNDHLGLAIAMQNTGNVYWAISAFKEAEKYYTDALKIFTDVKDTLGILDMNNNLGVIKKNTGDFENSIKHLNNSFNISEKQKDSVKMSMALANIANVYILLKDHKRCEESLKKALEISGKIKDTLGIINIHISLGVNNSKQEKLNAAADEYFKALEICKQTSMLKKKAQIMSNISGVFIALKRFDESLKYSKQAQAIFEELNDNDWIINTLQNQAENYFEKKDFVRTEKTYHEALKMANDNDLLLKQKNISLSLAHFYAKRNRFKQAYEYFETYSQLNDSVLNSDVAQKVEELNVRFETERKDHQIEVQTLTIETQTQEIEYANKVKWLMFTGLLIVLTFLAVVGIIYLQKQKAYKAIVKQNIEIVEKEKQLEKSIAEQKRVEKKYAGSTLDIKTKESLLEQLERLMQEKEPFLDGKLTIEDLSETLSTNKKYLSQVINEQLGKNFSNYINEFRVKKARRIILDPEFDHLSLEGIASTVGFHSKASFNIAFKKFTGVTPSFFKKNNGLAA